MPKIPASERDTFYENRRTELVEIALRLWAEKGFNATPVSAIAEAAGISKGALYLYFPSKQALLTEVLRRYSLLPSIQSLAQNIGGKSFEEAVPAFVREIWRHLSEHRDLIFLALRELPNNVDDARQAVEQVLVPSTKILEQYLQMQVGERRAKEISLLVAGRGLIGMTALLFLSREILGIGGLLPTDDEEIISTVSQVFLHGVLGPRSEV